MRDSSVQNERCRSDSIRQSRTKECSGTVDETLFGLEEASKMIQEKGYQFLGAKEVETKPDSGCNVQ